MPPLLLCRQRCVAPRLLITLVWSLAFGIGSASAAEPVGTDAGGGFLAALDGALSAGRISADQALLLQFQYGFAPDRLPPEFRPAELVPLKCATELVQRYRKRRDRLPPEVVRQIDGWLAPSVDDGQKSTYDPPGGHFSLSYSTTGPNAVPAADLVPADGIPDFVEKVAAYLDRCWAIEVDSLGFAAPPIGTGRYQVGFQAMNFYGYTTAMADPPGATKITLHNDFLGFPTNDDPEGIALGAAKISAAHEFKHATQRAGSLWSEGGWVELDATWMEDVVYDYVNDYYNYLPRLSPIGSPELPLDDGGSGSYEDCVFEHWLSETWGVRIIQDLWTWRRTHQGEPMLESYDRLLRDRGHSLTEGWPTFAAWNYACGFRAISGFGYGEAPDYPNSHLFATLSSYPAALSGTVAHLAARFVRCSNLPPSPGAIRVLFFGEDGTDVQCSAVITTTDGAAVVEPLALNDLNDATTLLTTPRSRILRLAFVISNGELSGADRGWSLVVDQVVAHPKLELSATALSDTVTQGRAAKQPLRITNGGDPGSILSWTAADPPAWLAVSPAAGSLDEGGVSEVSVSFNAGLLVPGRYETVLIFRSNAASSPDSVPVALTVAEIPDEGPLALGVVANRPNPFNPATLLVVTLPAAERVDLDVLDLQGRIVRRLRGGDLPAGRSLIPWDGLDDAGRRLPSGIYLARLHAGGKTASHKMLLAR